MAQKTENDNEKKKQNFSSMFLASRSDKANDRDYIVYDDIEEAELVLIPKEEFFLSRLMSEVSSCFSFSKDLSFAKLLTAFLEALGERTIDIFLAVTVGAFNIFKIPFILFWQRIVLVIFSVITKRFQHSGRKKRISDYRKFKEDARESMKTVRKAREEDFLTSVAEFRKHTAISFKKHRKVWLAITNIVFPLICFVILTVTVFRFTNLTFALQVNYNGNIIGYIENEDVYNTAKDTALKRLSTNEMGEKEELNAPTYQISLVSLNNLSDSDTICDGIIKNTDGNYVNACGIYINGEFACAIKNETDAVIVFDELLKPYKQKAGKNATVAFVEDISYVQSFYPEKSILDADGLLKKMSSLKSGTQYYTVSAGDTLSGIAVRFGLNLSQLLSMNPGMKDTTPIYVGEKLVVENQVKYVRVKVMKTEKHREWIPYETVTKETDKLYKGQSRTARNGKKGIEQITEMVTYIDGARAYSTTLSTKVLRKPVDKVIEKGTKAIVNTYSGGNYSNYISGSGSTTYTGGKLRWPTSGAYVISSYFGYRVLYGRTGFHGGVDIIRSGGNSTGLPVLAAAGGTVVSYTTWGSYGYSVLIDHGNGLKTRYAHMTGGSVSVRVGSKVSAGQQIGRIGSTGNVTGPHLHFEVIVNGNRVNPLPYIR